MEATSDTLALAAEERAKQGIHELEISFGGELDLHKHLNDCVKNPGHRKFIPIRKLTIHHIPKNNYEYDVFKWVRNVSRYTVKLSVHYVSPNRPTGYPLSDRAGQRVLSTGSGYVADIPPRGNDKMPCPFTNCGELPGNHEVCGYITVVTAAHVVFDDEEAKNTTVEFFYDEPDDRSGVMTARGVKVAASSVEGDFCELLCVTHDASLIERLNEPYRFINCFTVEISEHSDVHCNFSAVTPASFVFNFEDATNAALEHFLDDPEGSIVDIMRFSCKPEDFYELLCLTHDPRKLHQKYSLWEIGELSGRRICDLFQTLLPGIEHVECTSGIFFKFLVNIRLINLSDALQSLVLLQLFTVEDLSKLLKRSPCGYYSSHDLLKSISFKRADILHLIKNELSIARFINGGWQSTSSVHLREKLRDLRRTLRNPDAKNPRNFWHNFLSIISELVQFYCTVEKLRKRSLSSKLFFPEFSILNMQEAVSISNDTASVTVRILRRRERDAIRGYEETFLDDWSPRDKRAFGTDSENTKCLSELNHNDMLLVHIAHPHGQSKQVTFGRQTDCFTGEGFYHQLYTAPTCPGCSGGPVWMIPASRDLGQVYGVPHSGHIGNELNRGCSWTVYPYQLKL